MAKCKQPQDILHFRVYSEGRKGSQTRKALIHIITYTTDNETSLTVYLQYQEEQQHEVPNQLFHSQDLDLLFALWPGLYILAFPALQASHPYGISNIKITYDDHTPFKYPTYPYKTNISTPCVTPSIIKPQSYNL